jgi:fatty acid desaturase
MPSFGRNANAVIIGVACVVTAILYGALAPVFGYRVEWAGVTMLIALGAALGIMFFVLHTGGGE